MNLFFIFCCWYVIKCVYELNIYFKRLYYFFFNKILVYTHIYIHSSINKKKITLNKNYHMSMYKKHGYFQGKNQFSKHIISFLRFWMAMSWYNSWNSSVANILCRWQKPRKTWLIETSKDHSEIIYFRGLTFNFIVFKIIANIFLTERRILKHSYTPNK